MTTVPYSPQRSTKLVDEEAHCIDIGQDDQSETKLLWDWAVGGIEEGSGHHQQVEKNGGLDDVDVHLLEWLGEEMNYEDS